MLTENIHVTHSPVIAAPSLLLNIPKTKRYDFQINNLQAKRRYDGAVATSDHFHPLPDLVAKQSELACPCARAKQKYTCWITNCYKI
jgi:hypothetical protein